MFSDYGEEDYVLNESIWNLRNTYMLYKRNKIPKKTILHYYISQEDEYNPMESVINGTEDLFKILGISVDSEEFICEGELSKKEWDQLENVVGNYDVGMYYYDLVSCNINEVSILKALALADADEYEVIHSKIMKLTNNALYMIEFIDGMKKCSKEKEISKKIKAMIETRLVEIQKVDISKDGIMFYATYMDIIDFYFSLDSFIRVIDHCEELVATKEADAK
jgi:hypothetical protein